MSKRSRLRAQRSSPPAPAPVAPPPPAVIAAPAPGRERRFRRFLLLLLIGSGLFGTVIVAGCVSSRPSATAENAAEAVRRFAELHNAGNGEAANFLGRTPQTPPEPISQAEADRLNADFILRGDYQVLSTYAEGDATPPRFVLVLKGNPLAPQLQVRNEKNGVDRLQLTTTDPEVVVEVREGKLFGLKVRPRHFPEH